MNPEFFAIPVAIWSTALYVRSGARRRRRLILGGSLVVALVMRFTPAGRGLPSQVASIARITERRGSPVGTAWQWPSGRRGILWLAR